MAVYREMLSDWEYARRHLTEAAADELTKDIADLKSHISRMSSVWSVYAGRQVTRFKKPPQSGLKRKHEQRQK